jgi:membrane associated rhomboid family serine protease
MNRGNPFGGRHPSGIGGGLTGPIPTDLWFLLGLILFTLTLGSFQASQGFTLLMRLTPWVWMRGFIWQLVSYPFVAVGGSGPFWLLIEMVILFMFGRDVLTRLGRKEFWKLLLSATLVAGVAAVLVGMLIHLVAGAAALGNSFVLMQGQRMILTVLIAAFATMNRNATILLFFVLPIQARWFLLLEIVFAFLAFLSTHDLAGFIGICVAVAFTFGALTGWRTQGWILQWRLRAHQLWLKLRLAWLRRRRGLHIVRDEDKKDPWLH